MNIIYSLLFIWCFYGLIIRKETKKDILDVYDVITESFKSQEFSNQEEVNLVKNLRKTDDFIPADVAMLYEIEKDYFNNNSGKILFSDSFLP